MIIDCETVAPSSGGEEQCGAVCIVLSVWDQPPRLTSTRRPAVKQSGARRREEREGERVRE